MESFMRMKHGFYDRTRTRVVYHVCPSSRDSSDSDADLDEILTKGIGTKTGTPKGATIRPHAHRNRNAIENHQQDKRNNNTTTSASTTQANGSTSKLVTFNKTAKKTIYPPSNGSNETPDNEHTTEEDEGIQGKPRRKHTFLEKMMGPRDPDGNGPATPRLREAVQKLIREQRRIKMLLGLLDAAEIQREVDPVVAANMRRKLREKQLDILEQLKQGQLFASLGIDATLVERSDTPKSLRKKSGHGSGDQTNRMAKSMTTSTGQPRGELTPKRTGGSLENSPQILRSADIRKLHLIKSSMPNLSLKGRESISGTAAPRSPAKQRPQSWATIKEAARNLKTDPPQRKFSIRKGLLIRRKSTSEFAAAMHCRYRNGANSYSRLYDEIGGVTDSLGSSAKDITENDAQSRDKPTELSAKPVTDSTQSLF